MKDLTQATPDQLAVFFTSPWPDDSVIYKDTSSNRTSQRWVRVCSMLTTGPLKPWMATVLADIVDSQIDIGDLRANLAALAALAKAPATLLDGTEVQNAITSELLASPDVEQWKAIQTYKPTIKLIVRTLMEFERFSKWLYVEKCSGGVDIEAISHLGFWDLYLYLAQRLRGDGLPAKLPYQILVKGASEGAVPTSDGLAIASTFLIAMDKATKQMTGVFNYNDVFKVGDEATGQPMKHSEPHIISGPDVETAVKTKKAKAKSVEPPVPPPVDAGAEKAKVEALLQAVKKMVSQEVQQGLLQNTQLLESLVTSVLAASPLLLNSALTKVMAGQKGAIQQQVGAAVTTAMATMDLQKMVQAQITQTVGSKIDLNKLRQEIADKMLHSSDDYFAAVFDRIQVVTESGSVVGKLAIKETFAIKPPVLPEADKKAAEL